MESEFSRSSVWPREYRLQDGTMVWLREPPAGVLWLIGLPPLDLVPGGQPELPEYDTRPDGWSDDKWLRYQAYRKREWLARKKRWRDAGERLAELLVVGRTTADGEREYYSYSREPRPGQGDARLLDDTDLDSWLGLVRPDLREWEALFESKQWEYAAVTAQQFGGYPADVILGDPVRSALNIGIGQRWLVSERERAERERKKGGR